MIVKMFSFIIKQTSPQNSEKLQRSQVHPNLRFAKDSSGDLLTFHSHIA